MTEPSSPYVLDTHALHWYWQDPARLGPGADAAFQAITDANGTAGARPKFWLTMAYTSAIRPKCRRASSRVQERQACEFAGMLIHRDPAATFGWPPFTVTTAMVSAAARVPHECVEQWWRIVGDELADTEPYRRARMAWSR